MTILACMHGCLADASWSLAETANIASFFTSIFTSIPTLCRAEPLPELLQFVQRQQCCLHKIGTCLNGGADWFKEVATDMAQQIELSPFAQRYMEELKSLVSTDRKTISFLRTLAAENHEAEKLHIVVALQQHLYYHCALEHQLPVLYLVDCILKTVTEHYLAPLCPALPSMFLYVWRTSPKLHPSLIKLANTWRALLPAQTQAQVDQITATATSTSAAARTTPPHNGSAQRVHQGMQYRQPMPAADPRQAQHSQQYQQQQHYPQQHQHYHHHQQQNYSQQQQQQQQSLFGGSALAVAQHAQHAQPQVLMLAQPSAPVSATPQAIIAALPQSLPLQPQPAVAALLLPGGPLPVAPGNAVGVAASYMQTQQQPQHYGGQPSQLPVASSSGAAPAPSSSHDIMTALQSLVGRMTGGQGAAGVPGTQASSDGGAGAPGMGKVLGSRSLNASILKEFDQTAVDALLSSSSQTRTAFLDQRFLRTRRIKAAQQAGQPLSQRWFYNVDQWLLGAASQETDSAPAPGWEDEETAAAEAEAEALVEEDPSQPECAISGEPFERTYDPDTDKWYYVGAVVLTGETAAQHGVMDGSIVKVQCLAGQPSKLGLAAKGVTQAKQQAPPTQPAAQSSAPAAPAAMQSQAAASAAPAAPAAAQPSAAAPAGVFQIGGAEWGGPAEGAVSSKRPLAHGEQQEEEGAGASVGDLLEQVLAHASKKVKLESS